MACLKHLMRHGFNFFITIKTTCCVLAKTSCVYVYAISFLTWPSKHPKKKTAEDPNSLYFSQVTFNDTKSCIYISICSKFTYLLLHYFHILIHLIHISCQNPSLTHTTSFNLKQFCPVFLASGTGLS